MQSGERSSIVVTGAGQISAFGNPLRVQLLLACAAEERSLSALQHQTGAPLAKIHYHVTRLLAAELLVVSRTQRRPGRAIRFYRAVADSFVVPHASLPAAPEDRLHAELRQSLRNEQSRTGELSLLYRATPDGKIRVKLMPQEPAAPSRGLEMWRILKLDARQRSSLAAELGQVLERFATAKPGPGAEALLVHAAFAPHRAGT